MRYFARFRSILLGLMLAGMVAAQTPDSGDPLIEPVQPAAPSSDERILGVIPNYTTVDPAALAPALSPRDKFKLFVRETVDPFTFASAFMGAGLSQLGNNDPKYGNGMVSYSQRVGAAFADMATQNFFSDAVLATLFHQDPRYYRMGPGHSVFRRGVYAMSRLIITRQDSGRRAFNISGVLGMGMGIALSNAYYPSSSIGPTVEGWRFTTSVTGASLGNLLPEFWPDVKQKLFHH